MQPVKTTHLTAVGQRGALPYVTGADEVKQEVEGLMTESSDPTPNSGFDLMGGETLLRRSFDIALEVVQGVIQALGVAIGTRLLHLLHDAAPVC
jgi:hypothetical protein